jgi:hypothetical protein
MGDEPDDVTVSSYGSPRSWRHDPTVVVAGCDGERGARTCPFVAVVEQLLSSGGYSVRDMMATNSRRSWIKIEDPSRVNPDARPENVNPSFKRCEVPSLV